MGDVVKHEGKEVYKVLKVFEFSSERKMMSVVVKSPSGKVLVFAKGADSIILPKLVGEDQDAS